MKAYYVYIVRCANNSLYTGSTGYLYNRLKSHNNGEGSAYTKIRRPIKLVYLEKFYTLKEARKRERQIKRWSKKKKDNLIKYRHPNPKKIKQFKPNEKNL